MFGGDSLLIEVTGNYSTAVTPNTHHVTNTSIAGIYTPRSEMADPADNNNAPAVEAIPAAAAAATARTMPLRNDKGALSFDSSATKIKRYLQDVEDLVGRCGGNEGNMVYYAMYYCDKVNEDRVRNLWEDMEAPTWGKLKKELLVLYVGTDSEDKRYTMSSIEQFVAKVGIKDTDKAVEYVKQFRTQALFLKRQKVTSDGEMSRMFCRGVPAAMEDRLCRRLENQHPQVRPGDTYKLQDVLDAFLWIGAAATANLGIGATSTFDQKVSPVKTEPTEMWALTEALKGFTSVMMNTMAQNNRGGFSGGGGMRYSGGGGGYAGGSGGGYVGGGRPQQGPTGDNRHCLFCGVVGHIIPTCPTADEYIRGGKLTRNGEGKIVMMNGRFIPSYIAGETMKEKLDRYMADSAHFVATGSTKPDEPANVMLWESATVSAMSLEAAVRGQQEAVSEEEAEVLKLEMMAAEARKGMEEKKRKKQVFDGVQVTKRAAPPGIPTLPYVAVKETDKGKAKDSVAKGNDAMPSNAGPQFKYQTPLEDPKLTKAVLERVLDAKVELSQRELLALAPDIRKQIKEMATTKRVAVSSMETTEAFLTQVLELEGAGGGDMAEERIVAAERFPLRYIDTEIHGKHKVNCVLDTGSQIIAMNRKVWERIGMPILSQHTIVMESANKTTSKSLGLMNNVALRIGPLILYIQVQVMDNVPFEVLLGRPFQALTNCVTRDFANGQQHVTLQDPNSGVEVTVPTFERGREDFQ